MTEIIPDLPIIVFGGDLVINGLELGPESKKRCDRAAELFHELENGLGRKCKPYIVLCSGWIDLWKKFPHQRHSMAKMMASYLKEKHSIPEDGCLLGPEVVGLKAEFKAGILHALWNGHPICFHLVSNRWGVIRLKCLSYRVQKKLGYSFLLDFTYVSV